MNGTNYYNGINLLQHKCQYNIIYGKKSNGKSYFWRKYTVLDAIAHPETRGIVYVRRFKDNTQDYKSENYYADSNIEEWTGGKYNCISVFRHKIYVGNIDEKGKKSRELKIGDVVSVQDFSDISSQVYKEAYWFIYEEFITQDLYLPRECNKLMTMINTIMRGRDFRAILIGNTISRLCPYFTEWALFKIPKQKMNTIDIYEKETELVDINGKPNGTKVKTKIGVEYTGARGDNASGYFGSSATMILQGGWQCEPEPHLATEREDYDLKYTMVFEFNEFKFLMEYLKRDANYCWYVSRKTTDIKEKTRVISNHISENRYYTIGFIPLSKGESIIFTDIKNNNIFFSDDLTGNEFKQCLKNFNY